MTSDRWEPPRNGPLIRVADVLLQLGIVYFIVLFFVSVHEHSRWTHAPSILAAYVLPLSAAAALSIVLRSSTSARVTALFILVPLVVTILAADLFLAVPGRLIRKAGMHFIVQHQPGVIAAKLRHQGIHAYPSVNPAEFKFGRYMRKFGTDSILPVSGIANVPTVLCSEGDLDVTYNSDENGFNNPQGIWKPDSVDIVLIGDSFVAGACLPPPAHFASILREKFPRTVNTGISGTGPLSQLAVLREYVAPIRPRRVLWFFFEGNDMEDLSAEKSFILSHYLDSGFSQNLIQRRAFVNSALIAYADSAIVTGSRTKPIAKRLHDLILLRDLRNALGLEAGRLDHDVTPDYATFSRALAAGKKSVDSWNGELILVYLPEQHRLDHSFPQPLGEHHDENDIRTHTLAIARQLNIPVLDMSETFARDRNPRAVWWRPRTHLSPYGNRVLADAVLAYLR